MKRESKTNAVWPICMVAILIMGFIVNLAGATTLYEGFDYNPADGTLAINGLNGGTGFGGAWYDCYTGDNPGKIVNGVSYDSLPVSGGALQRTSRYGSDATARTISGAAQSALTGDDTTMWFSVLMKASNGGVGLAYNSYATLIFVDAGLAGGAADISGAGVPEINTGGSAVGVGFAGTANGTSYYSDMRIQGVTYQDGVSSIIRGDRIVVGNDLVMVVGKVDWAAGGTDDVLSLYNISDPAAALPNAFTTMTADLDQSTFNIISIGDAQISLFDEIRFGTSYDDVVPEVVTPPVSTDAIIESFDYLAGTIIAGQGGVSDLWAGSWTGSGDNMHEVVGGLSFSTFPVSGGAAQRPTRTGDSEMSRRITADQLAALTAENTTVWFSVLMNPGSAAGGFASNSYGTLIFGDSAFTGGLGYSAAPIAAGGNGVGVGFAGSASFSDMRIQGVTYKNGILTENSAERTVVGDTTVFVVGKIDWAANGSYDVVSLYNVLDPSGPLPPAFSTMAVDLDQSQFNLVAIGDAQCSIFDEIRLGAAYNDVVAMTVDAGVDMVTWSEEPVQLAPTVFNDQPVEDLTYAWSADPVDGVGFSAIDVEDPLVTIIKTTENPSVVTLTLSVNYIGETTDQAVQDTMTIDVYDDRCMAAKAVDPDSLDPSDLNKDCSINILDLGLLAQTWLYDYTPTVPFAK